MPETEYDDTNRGVMFPNDRKKTDRHPDFKGTINVGGVDYDIAAWKKVSKKGNNMITLSVSKPYVGDEYNQERGRKQNICYG